MDIVDLVEVELRAVAQRSDHALITHSCLPSRAQAASEQPYARQYGFGPRLDQAIDVLLMRSVLRVHLRSIKPGEPQVL